MFKIFLMIFTVLFSHQTFAGNIQCQVISTHIMAEEDSDVRNIKSITMHDNLVEVYTTADSSPDVEVIWQYNISPYLFNGHLILRGQNMSFYTTPESKIFEVQFQEPEAELINEWPLYISKISCANSY